MDDQQETIIDLEAKKDCLICKVLPHEKEGNERRLIAFAIELILFAGLSVIFVITGKSLENSKPGNVEAWRWCIVTYVLVAGLILGLWVMDTLVLLVGLVYRLLCLVFNSETRRDKLEATKRHKFDGIQTAAHVVLGLRQSGACFIWIAALLVAWVLLIVRAQPTDEPNEKTRKALNYTTRALIGFLIGSTIWTMKTLLLEIVALYFIVCRAEKKKEETRTEQLYLRIIWENSGLVVGETDVKEGQGKMVFPREYRHIMKAREWTPKFVIDEITETQLPAPFDNSGNKEVEVIDDMSVKRTARLAGEKIFNEIAKKYGRQSNQDYSKIQFVIYSEQDQKEQGEKDELMMTLAKVIRPDKPLSNDKSIEPGFLRSAFIKWMEKVYVNRFVLLRTLNGRDEAVKNLNWIVSANVLVIILIVWLFEMGLLTTQVLIAIITPLITINFVFGDSAKTVFQAILFVFVTQPFDVGDRIQAEKNGPEMVVRDMNILGTVATLTNGERVFYPNSDLVGKDIVNFYFAPDLSDAIAFRTEVPSGIDHLPQKRKTETTGKFEYKKNTGDQPEKKPEFRARKTLGVLQDRIERYLKKNSEKWKPDATLEHYLDEPKHETMWVILNVNHAIHYYDEGDWRLHREELESKVKKYLEEFKIKLL